MEFVEAPSFTRSLPRYLEVEAYRELQNQLAANPEMGALMPGTGGFRKLRWAEARAEEADCGSSTTTSVRIIRFG